MGDEPALPHAVWSGSFHIFGVEVRCHNLSDGQRIIEAESVNRLMEAMGAEGTVIDQAELEAFARWRQG